MPIVLPGQFETWREFYLSYAKAYVQDARSLRKCGIGSQYVADCLTWAAHMRKLAIDVS